MQREGDGQDLFQAANLVGICSSPDVEVDCIVRMDSQDLIVHTYLV